MQVTKIKSYLASYPEWMNSEAGEKLRAVWETQQNWQTNFDLAAKDLRDVYDRSLTNKTNRRHFRREAYDPKRAILEMIDWEPEHVRTVFEDLFSEERDLEGRVQRFVFYCRELFNQYRDAKPKSRLPDHFHDDDYGMASLYLACQYPEKYAPYSTELLQESLKNLGALQVPEVADFPRYTKLLATLSKFVNEDGGVQSAYQKFLRPQDYQGDTKLLVWHFLRHVTAAV
ncbi:hypothetical protein CEQ90_07495 [Lewinellaceae bacterium SD302]|nr:hypothetical protein CEQ90_07495 [Lewinellaceae bacterium SD302]